MFTGDAGVVSMALVGVVEEASQSLGLHRMVVVVRDEAVQGVIDTFAVEQGADGKAAEDLDNTSSMRLASAFLLLGASSISSVCRRMRACLVIRSLKRKIVQQRSISEVHNSYQSATINNFHGMTSYKFRVAPHRYI